MGLLPDTLKLPVAHTLGMPGTFSPSPQVSDPDMHYGTCLTHVPWCMPGSLTRSFLWSQWRGGKRSRRMRNPKFHISGKRPMHNSCDIQHLPSDITSCRGIMLNVDTWYIDFLNYSQIWQYVWESFSKTACRTFVKYYCYQTNNVG